MKNTKKKEEIYLKRGNIYLCMKTVHFMFNNKIYTENDNLAMSSPIGLLLANGLMVELEIPLVKNLSSKLSSRRPFVDDSICFLKKDSMKFVLDTLNNFHKNIKFNFEEERDRKIPFLDALLVRNNDYIVTTIYAKNININIYLNWNSFGSKGWYTQNNCY